MSLIAHAVTAVQRGWHVFPANPAGARCPQSGEGIDKQPHLITPDRPYKIRRGGGTLLGADEMGRPVYGYPVAPPVAPQQPILARPWGAYFALAVPVTIALTFLMIGLAVVAVCIAVATVALTICVLVLRSVWQDMRKEKRR